MEDYITTISNCKFSLKSHTHIDYTRTYCSTDEYVSRNECIHHCPVLLSQILPMQSRKIWLKLSEYALTYINRSITTR